MTTTRSQAEVLRLPDGFTIRPASWDDLQAVTQLVFDTCQADGDPDIATSLEDLRHEWQSEGFSLATDSWVVTGPDGRVVGYEEFVNRHASASLQGDGYVHPEFRGLGIGTALLRALETRCRLELDQAEPGLRVFVRNGMNVSDKSGLALHEAEGYRPIRYSWVMHITLDSPPPEPQWPDGIALRPFVPDEQNRAVFEAHEEAFSDHWGHTPGSYANWQAHMTGRESFDPALWFIAWDGDQVAGYSLCRYRADLAWVGSLGVRRPWRKRGLGLALLYHSFGEFYRRGRQTIALGVDAQNPTGATRLYLKAGMHVAHEYVIYEKELRPGREPEE